MMKIGILSFQGGVIEHVRATKEAAKALGMTDSDCEVIEVKRAGDFASLSGLIIPGGESTTLGKLIERNNLWDEIRKVPNIFGTCAGAIMLAKKVIGQEEGGQKFLELMDIEADRNAYGSQIDSFEEEVGGSFGKLNAIFIRAPKIKQLSDRCEVIAKRANGEPIAISERTNASFYLATSFHPELSTSKLHEYFLKECGKTQNKEL